MAKIFFQDFIIYVSYQELAKIHYKQISIFLWCLKLYYM